MALTYSESSLLLVPAEPVVGLTTGDETQLPHRIFFWPVEIQRANILSSVKVECHCLAC